MKQLQMNKKEIGKEIEALIKSIKLHYDNIADEIRIPSIELELITSKIRKLHEKSIVFNHLHHMEEQYAKLNALEEDNVSDENESAVENFIINAAEVPTPIAQPIVFEHINVEPKIEPIIEEKVAPIPTPIIEEKPIQIEVKKPIEVVEKVVVVSQPTAPETIASSTTDVPKQIVGKDLKKIIGFSDKYFFISQLFAGNAEAFTTELNALNYLSDNTVAMNYLSKLEKENAWMPDNEAYQSLKRYITNKYN